jgi:hypothetical protein
MAQRFASHYPPGALRGDLLRLATYRRKGRVPKEARIVVDPDLPAAMARTAGERETLREQLEAGRLVCFGVSAPEAVWLPRGLLPQVRALADVQVVDRRLAFRRMDFRWRSELDATQYRAVSEIVRQGGGLLHAPTRAARRGWPMRRG